MGDCMSGSGRYRGVIVIFAEGNNFRMENFEVYWLVLCGFEIIANVHINICVIVGEFLLVLLY